MTDGLITEGYGEGYGSDSGEQDGNGVDLLYDLINTLDTDYDATIFTYSMGDASLKEVPH